jgi:hypothetical protein
MSRGQLILINHPTSTHEIIVFFKQPIRNLKKKVLLKNDVGEVVKGKNTEAEAPLICGITKSS